MEMHNTASTCMCIKESSDFSRDDWHEMREVFGGCDVIIVELKLHVRVDQPASQNMSKNENIHPRISKKSNEIAMHKTCSVPLDKWYNLDL